ncbi:putative lipid II flippase FtsW [Candidatus Berkelbacteria bacterium]|nr:putative lipid II flippase FtsW [Candidatus Berkelbacteria bacterium]
MALTKFRGHSRARIDGWLLIALLVLVGFGLVMISSASVVLSSERFGSNYVYASQQLMFAGLGLAALAITSVIDYRFWQKLAPWLLIAIIGLLIAVFIPGLGDLKRGTQGWIVLGPLEFQAAEVVKLMAILFFGAWLAAREDRLQSLATGFLPFVVTLGLIVLLIMAQPDAGTAVVLLGTIVTMYFVAGAPYFHLAFGGLLGGGLLALLILSAPYRLQRFLVFLNPTEETLGAAYHINQALLAVGAGGLLGLGFGQSKQKFLYLPEPHTDSIFAIAIEELGFVRAILILGLILFVILRGYQIARRVPDAYGRYVAVGITTLIAIQTFVNIGAMLGLMPITGVTLPFVSYGGSSLVVLLAAAGILLNISRQAQLESTHA